MKEVEHLEQAEVNKVAGEGEHLEQAEIYQVEVGGQQQEVEQAPAVEGGEHLGHLEQRDKQQVLVYVAGGSAGLTGRPH